MNESRRRENAIDRELTRAFRAERAAGDVGDHLDGEVAAAWMEQGLEAGARARVESHLADCAQCQALIATLSRISPPGREPASDPWWHWLRTPWLVPAAAATIAVAVWVVVPSQNQPAAPQSVQARLEDRSSSAPPSAEAPATLPAPAAAPPAAPPPAPSEARPTPAPAAPTARRAEAAEQDSSESKASESNLQPSIAVQARGASARERQEVADALANTAAGAAAPAPAEPPPAPAAAAKGALSQEAARTTAAGTAADARTDRAQAPSAFATAPRLVVMTADGTGRWRIAGGRIQYAPRNGAPWISAAALDASGLIAGAAPGGLVCWIVGRAGTVLLTTDAVRFSRVAAPAATDLISVRATDARTATVTAADGRRFSTTDQGASWTLVTR